MKFFPYIFWVFAFSFSCDSSEKSTPKLPKTPPVITKATQETPKETKAKNEIQPIVISEKGIPALKNFKIDLEHLQKAFKGYDVKEESYSAEGEKYSRFAVYKKKEKLLEIDPDEGKIYRLAVVSPHIKNESGPVLGQKRKDIKFNTKVECNPGVEESFDHLFCSSKSSALSYEFRPPKASKEKAKKGNWILESIIWIPGE